jgi:hypothetical protein
MAALLSIPLLYSNRRNLLARHRMELNRPRFIFSFSFVMITKSRMSPYCGIQNPKPKSCLTHCHLPPFGNGPSSAVALAGALQQRTDTPHKCLYRCIHTCLARTFVLPTCLNLHCPDNISKITIDTVCESKHCSPRSILHLYTYLAQQRHQAFALR